LRVQDGGLGNRKRQIFSKFLQTRKFEEENMMNQQHFQENLVSWSSLFSHLDKKDTRKEGNQI